MPEGGRQGPGSGESLKNGPFFAPKATPAKQTKIFRLSITVRLIAESLPHPMPFDLIYQSNQHISD